MTQTAIKCCYASRMAMGWRCESHRPWNETELWTLRTMRSKMSLATARESQRVTKTAKSCESNEVTSTRTHSAQLFLTMMARNWRNATVRETQLVGSCQRRMPRESQEPLMTGTR